MGKKRFISMIMAGLMAFWLTACDDDWEEYEDAYYEEYGDEEDRPYEDNSSAGQGGASVLKGVSLQVNEDDGKLVITRETTEKEGETGDVGVWTIFVYLCGADRRSQRLVSVRGGQRQPSEICDPKGQTGAGG